MIEEVDLMNKIERRRFKEDDSKKKGDHKGRLSHSDMRLHYPGSPEAIWLNDVETFCPNSFTAAMQITAIKATNRPYSTNDAPRLLVLFFINFFINKPL